MNDHPIPGINNTMQIDKAMNIPGNPTENPTEERLNELRAAVIDINESIKKQEHIKWLADVEIARQKKALKANLASIETITKGPES
jgi:hypothetical protein